MLLLASILSPTAGRASESAVQDRPAPTSVHEMQGSLERGLEKKPGIIGRFFHHEDKSEEEAKQEDPTPEPTHEEKKHHFLHGLFHHGD